MTDQAVDAYHLNRQMFFLSPEGKVWVHPGPTRDDHRTWAARLGLDWGRAGAWARGYYWPDTDSLYVYTDGDLPPAVDHFRAHAERVRLALQLHPRTRVFGGVKPGPAGAPWEPIHDLGTFGTLHGITTPRD